MASPASVVILGTSTPVRTCARFRRPLGAAEAVEIAAAGGDAPGNVTTNELRWMEYPRYNQIARTLAVATGASFIDVAAPSALRPDGAMGGYWPSTLTPSGQNKQLDCVHYCLPGVVDTWNALLYNLLTSPRLRRALDGSPPPAERAAGEQLARGAGGGGRSSAKLGSGTKGSSAKGGAAKGSARGSRFLSANATEWLTVKGYAERFEKCTMGGHGSGRCEARMQLQPWWAFRCIEPRDRGYVHSKDYSAQYKPWHPCAPLRSNEGHQGSRGWVLDAWAELV